MFISPCSSRPHCHLTVTLTPVVARSGKAISLHSQVIKDFCKQIGVQTKQAQGLIRLAKKNGMLPLIIERTGPMTLCFLLTAGRLVAVTHSIPLMRSRRMARLLGLNLGSTRGRCIDI